MPITLIDRKREMEKEKTRSPVIIVLIINNESSEARL